jgi:proline iminopeptidase
MIRSVEARTSKISETDWKYPQSSCIRSDWLIVNDDPPLASPHRLHWAEYGNPTGEPVMFIHGGPGGGCTDKPTLSRYFDPERYRIILFDQRGCGKSEPNAAAKDPKPALLNNETPYLVEDIIQLRNELRIRGKMHVFGGSWGSTLALAYAIEHPETVQTLILRGIFLCRKKELNYFYQGNAAADRPGTYDSELPGAYMFFPEAWKPYVEMISDLDDRKDMIAAYASIFNGADEERRNAAAKAWSIWEGCTSYLQQDMNDLDQYADPEFAKAFALIENHYFMNGAFLGGKAREQNYLLENVDRIKQIPIHIVQGRYDQVCPMYQAEELFVALKGVGSAFINYVITAAGHSAQERENCLALTDIMDKLPPMNPSDARIEELNATIKRIEDRLTAIERRNLGS